MWEGSFHVPTRIVGREPRIVKPSNALIGQSEFMHSWSIFLRSGKDGSPRKCYLEHLYACRGNTRVFKVQEPKLRQILEVCDAGVRDRGISKIESLKARQRLQLNQSGIGNTGFSQIQFGEVSKALQVG